MGLMQQSKSAFSSGVAGCVTRRDDLEPKMDLKRRQSSLHDCCKIAVVLTIALLLLHDPSRMVKKDDRIIWIIMLTDLVTDQMFSENSYQHISTLLLLGLERVLLFITCQRFQLHYCQCKPCSYALGIIYVRNKCLTYGWVYFLFYLVRFQVAEDCKQPRVAELIAKYVNNLRAITWPRRLRPHRLLHLRLFQRARLHHHRLLHLRPHTPAYTTTTNALFNHTSDSDASANTCTDSTPQPSPTPPPTPQPTSTKIGAACCSQDGATCITWGDWGGSTQQACYNGGNVWLPNGPPCTTRWNDCNEMTVKPDVRKRGQRGTDCIARKKGRVLDVPHIMDQTD
jgi:hypothetical protein